MWKEVLALSVILTQVNSLMRDLPINLSQSLVIQTSFGHENPTFNAENVPDSMSETQRLCNLEGGIATLLQ